MGVRLRVTVLVVVVAGSEEPRGTKLFTRCNLAPGVQILCVIHWLVRLPEREVRVVRRDLYHPGVKVQPFLPEVE